MFQQLESLAEDADHQDVTVIFHNLKGYNGMFAHFNTNHCEVMDQICIGTKPLSFKLDELAFQGSLCFLTIPLASFPFTFGSQELV